jgi:hypothetical protein
MNANFHEPQSAAAALSSTPSPNTGLGAKEVKDIVRYTLEQGGEYGGARQAETLGLRKEVLHEVFQLLVRDYVNEGQFDLALSAARAAKDPDCYRLLLGHFTQPATASRCGMDGAMQVFSAAREKKEVLIGTQDAQLLLAYARDEIRAGHYENAIDAYRAINAGRALMDMGQMLESDCVARIAQEPGTKTSHINGFNRIASAVTSTYTTALQLGETTATHALVKWGDFLAANGQALPGTDSHRSEMSESALGAYLASAGVEGFEKAATLYQSSAQQRSQPEKAIADLKVAAELFFKAQRADGAMEVILEIAAKGDVNRAITLLTECSGAPDLNVVRKLIALSVDRALDVVKDQVTRYLDKTSGDCPFWTQYTYWHFSDGNSEWSEYTNRIRKMTGNQAGHSSAKPLFSSPLHRENATNLDQELQKHLLVGYMLSALTTEAKHGPCANRKYEHPAHAAWRTFENAVNDGPYNPFSLSLKLKEDELVAKVYALVENFESESAKLCITEGGWLKETHASRLYRAEHLRALQGAVKDIYGQMKTRIAGLLESF